MHTWNGCGCGCSGWNGGRRRACRHALRTGLLLHRRIHHHRTPPRLRSSPRASSSWRTARKRHTPKHKSYAGSGFTGLPHPSVQVDGIQKTERTQITIDRVSTVKYGRPSSYGESLWPSEGRNQDKPNSRKRSIERNLIFLSIKITP